MTLQDKTEALNIVLDDFTQALIQDGMTNCAEFISNVRHHYKNNPAVMCLILMAVAQDVKSMFN